MDREAWWATVHGADTTEVTEHAHMHGVLASDKC